MTAATSTPEIHALLLVDDDASFRDAVRRTLRQAKALSDLQVIEAENGIEGAKRVETTDFDCILLDYQMPGGTGLYWLNRLLTLRPDAAIIMVTGGGSEDVAVEAMKRGAMDYLVKGTIAPEALQRAILNAVQKKRMARLIREQQADLLEAERHRVMIESVGAACHHLGQPATVIRICLESVMRREQDPELRAMISEGLTAADSLADILLRLQTVSQYRTTPYLHDQNAPHILDIQPS